MDFISQYIIPVIFIGFGGVILFQIYAPLQKNNYVSALSKIIEISKYESRSSQQDAGITKYGIRLSYQYEIQGISYTSKSIFKNADSYASSDPAWASQFAKKYPEGKEISVFVNNSDPTDAYIIERFPGTSFFAFLAALAVSSGFLIEYFNQV